MSQRDNVIHISGLSMDTIEKIDKYTKDMSLLLSSYYTGYAFEVGNTKTYIVEADDTIWAFDNKGNLITEAVIAEDIH